MLTERGKIMADMIKDGTKKLYYEDAYATAFHAKVLSCREKTGKKNRTENFGQNSGSGFGTTDRQENSGNFGKLTYEVVLDQTLFFPEEGGQSPDRGTLNGCPVSDVQIRDGVIAHTVLGLSSPLKEGEEVAGQIDFTFRFSNMQQHSGEHIFSGLAHSAFGYDNVGFHLSDHEVTLDLSGPMSAEDISKIEHKANEVITSNIETVITYPTKEEEKLLTYRSKIEIEGQTRLVSFPGYDVCACCAPHVKRTGEIGLLKVVSAVNYKGGTRISILCGARAMELFDSDHECVTRTANYLTTSADQIYDSVVRMKDDQSAMKAQLLKAAKEKMLSAIASVPADAGDVLLFVPEAETKAVRDAVNELTSAHEGFSSIFVGNDQKGYSFITGTKTGDSRIIGNLLKEKLKARCGGKPEMIQGSVSASEDEIRKVIDAI